MGLSVFNFAFTDHRAWSASGNYVFAILKISYLCIHTEGYNEILAGLKDVCDETKDIEDISNVTWFLGGDWKFLATVCGLDNAMSSYVYGCI